MWRTHTLQHYLPPGFPPPVLIITKPNTDEVPCYQGENSTNIKSENADGEIINI